MASTLRPDFTRGLQYEIPLIYAANNSIPYIDKNIARFTGVPESDVYRNHEVAITGNLSPWDKTVFFTEVYNLMQFFIRKPPDNKVVCRAKMKVSSYGKPTYWVIFEVPEVIYQNNLYEASLNVIFDISHIHQDNLHKFIYYDKDTHKIIYENYYPSADMTRYYITRRELQVINLLADGFSSIEIAEKLSLQPDTIKKHRKNVIQKLSDQIKIRNTPHLVKFACKHGMIMDNTEFANLWEKEEYEGSFKDYDYVRVGEG